MTRLPAPAIVLLLAVPAAAQEAGDPAVAWIRDRAVPIRTPEAGGGFEDLQPFKKIVGDARIVSLGESTHGSREIFQMKHRLVEFLASEMGFTLFSIEANLPEAYRVNGFVRGGPGNPDDLIAGMYFWTWNTLEVKEMVEWMRRFNAAGKGKIEFTGFDMQFPDAAMDEVLKFLKGTDDALHAAAEKTYAASRRKAGQDFGVVTGTFPVVDARGRKLVFRGWIKTEDVKGFAGLWWRCDGPGQTVLAFENMASQEISGTRDWTRYSLALTVPEKTTNINFGVILPGTGTAWFDGLEVEFDGKRWESPGDFDFDFESDSLVGFQSFDMASYTTEFDTKVVKSGKKSLRLRSRKVEETPVDPRKAFKECKEVLKSIVAARDELAKKKPAREVDWAIVNARVASSAVGLPTGQVQRDAEMAANVEWILEQNPGARIVLWAHNGHVARMPFMMGKYLDRKFGKAHLAVGFATSKGEYRAVGDRKLGNHRLQEPPGDSYEAAFQRTKVPRFFLDLRDVDAASDASGWLARPHPFRLIGALAMEQQFNPQNLPSLFDAVIYLEETTGARPIP